MIGGRSPGRNIGSQEGRWESVKYCDRILEEKLSKRRKVIVFVCSGNVKYKNRKDMKV